MSLPDKCPFCGAGVRAVKDGNQRWVEFECFSMIGDVGGKFQYRSPICRHNELSAAKARVAELEARVREAEESNANALARLAAAEATIEFRQLENEAARRQLGHAENACDAMEKRLAELEVREKQAREDEAWVNGDGLVEFQPVTAGWVASTLDGLHSIMATAPTIHGALRALREKIGGAR